MLFYLNHQKNLNLTLIMTIKKDQKAYKTIGEVAKILNLINTKTGSLSTHTLRFWEKEFIQIKPKIFSGKRRYYNNETIQLLKKIHYLLKEKGMTIQGVKKVLSSTNSNLDELDNTSINTKKVLKSKIDKISNILKDLKK